ncbi:stress response protein NST1 [Ananas comosus]|uniref:Stress response protein NST1 n=2 Tax=Ananas comosus TaxID=4615 RepID=A0A199VD54_ANACO|nr:stress response protein NST1 [Ananas comosus]OAY74700.1 hypothetical protein ACMD2_09320 [Ananas comosus]
MAFSRPSLLPEIGPDGLARDSPIIAYTEKVIEEEQLQLKKYIQENYSKIRDVERELENLSLEMKLTAGPKKQALEHLRKKIELATERIRMAKLKEEQAKKAWEAAAQAVRDEEEAKKKLCDDLNQLVQEGAATQYSRLEELKKRLEALNPSRLSSDVSDRKPTEHAQSNPTATQQTDIAIQAPENVTSPVNNSGESASSGGNTQRTTEMKEKKRPPNPGRGRGSLVLHKGRGTSSGSGWTGAGFDVDGGT